MVDEELAGKDAETFEAYSISEVSSISRVAASDEDALVYCSLVISAVVCEEVFSVVFSDMFCRVLSVELSSKYSRVLSDKVSKALELMTVLGSMDRGSEESVV